MVEATLAVDEGAAESEPPGFGTELIERMLPYELEAAATLRPCPHLGDLLAARLNAYDDTGVIGDRVRVVVPDALVAEGVATTLALVVHELAMNSLKYGALSKATGTLDGSCTVDEGDADNLCFYCKCWTLLFDLWRRTRPVRQRRPSVARSRATTPHYRAECHGLMRWDLIGIRR